jgi:lipid II:glycine glycyltransferase (peptidoglycan interpeptide bridge formation enzyme)
MQLKEINIDTDFELWNSIILNSPDFYTVAHNPSLIKYLDKTLQWKGKSFIIMNVKEVIGIYQHSFPSANKSVSMPHFSYGGIIRKNDSYSKKEIFSKISNNLEEAFEIRDFEPYTSYFDDSKVAAFLMLEETAEAQLAILKSNHRRKIKKAYKNNLEVKIESSKDAILDFYKIYTKNMLRLGSPSLSKKFFMNLIEYYKFGEVKVFLVYKNQEIIGGAIALSYNDFMEDCWLSTISKYNHLYTSVLLYWEMIKDAIENNKKIFSFGRSTKGSSLLKFKGQWNPIEKQLYFSYSEKQKISLKKMTFLTKLWKLLPLRVANIIGPKIADKLY